MTEEEIDEGINLSDIFRVLIKKYIILVLFFIIGVSFGFIYYFTNTKYEAKGSVLVSTTLIKDESKTILDKSNTMVQIVNSLVKRDQIIENVIIDNQLNLTIEEFNLKYDLSSSIDNNFIDIKIISKDKDNINQILNSIMNHLIIYMNDFKSLYTLNEFDFSINIIEDSSYVLRINKNIYLCSIIFGFGFLFIGSIIILCFELIKTRYLSISEFKNDFKDNIYDKTNTLNYIIINELKNNYHYFIIESDNQKYFDIIKSLDIKNSFFVYAKDNIAVDSRLLEMLENSQNVILRILNMNKYSKNEFKESHEIYKNKDNKIIYYLY